MYDALLHNLEIARTRSQMIERLGLQRGEYALATVHRAANTDKKERMESILNALGRLPISIVFPLHPRARKMMREWNLSVGGNVLLTEPLGHFDMLALQENANCILTDSGGLYCITLREETEWVETVAAGWNLLAGVDTEKIIDLFGSWFPQGERPHYMAMGALPCKSAAFFRTF